MLFSLIAMGALVLFLMARDVWRDIQWQDERDEWYKAIMTKHLGSFTYSQLIGRRRKPTELDREAHRVAYMHEQATKMGEDNGVMGNKGNGNPNTTWGGPIETLPGGLDTDGQPGTM